MSQPSVQAGTAGADSSYDPLAVLAYALTAPAEQPLGAAQIRERLAELLGAARERKHEACRTLTERLTPIAESDADSLAGGVRGRYPLSGSLAEDVYGLRAFVNDPEKAAQIAEMRRYLSEAAVPESEHELALDRAIADGQVSYGLLLPQRKQRQAPKERGEPMPKAAEAGVAYGVFSADPRRLATAELAFEHFRSVYSRRYEEWHAAYWQDASGQHARLEAAGRRVQALLRLNSLSELGPPVGAGVVERYEQLSEETSGCETVELRDVLKTEPVCPSCGICLGESELDPEVEEVLDLTRRAIEQQLRRLSSVAVRAVLERSNDPRVDRFLKVVQATQITTLAEILDDDLVGYLRRFLLEARISTLLEPILDRVERGGAATETATRDSLQELAEVLHRALRGAGRALPEAPGEPPPGGAA